MKGLAAAALLRWDRLRTEHPRLGRLLAPPLLGLWWVATRLRPSLADLRGPQVSAEGPSTSGEVGTPAVPEATPVEPDAQSPADERVVEPLAEDTAPRVIASPESLVAAGIEYVYLVPGEGVFVVGWLFDPLERVISLRAMAGESSSGNVLDEMDRRPRPDVRETYLAWTHAPEQRGYGLAGLIQIPDMMRDDVQAPLRFELSDVDGQSWSVLAPSVRRDPASPLTTIAEILDRFPAARRRAARSSPWTDDRRPMGQPARPAGRRTGTRAGLDER